jgi:hypothetical protein
MIGLLLCVGCASLQQDRFVVKPSALDYLQIVRTHSVQGNDRPVTMRLDLDGSGYLQMTAGRSERVRTGFWQEASSAEWQDLRRDYVVLSPEKTRAYFQAFVDAGAYDKPPENKNKQEPELAILIAIGSKKNLRLTSDPAFLQLYHQLLREF